MRRGWRHGIQRESAAGRDYSSRKWLQQPDVPAGNEVAVQDEKNLKGFAAGGIGHMIAAQALVLEHKFVLAEFQSRITD